MTHWATLWYAGAVVMQMGYEGQTLTECESLIRAMQEDIERTYQDQTMTDEISQSMFPTNQFTVSCETESLPIDEKYTQ